MSALDLGVVVAVPGGSECFVPGGAAVAVAAVPGGGAVAVVAVPGGGAVTVRRAVERDRAVLDQMLTRCSSQTRYRRFHGHVKAFPNRFLTEAISGDPVHFALVGEAGDGSVVAFANCRTVTPRAAELGILVEDAYQRLGIGAVLLREMAGYAGRGGLTMLKAQVLGEQGWLIRLLAGYGACEWVSTRGVLDVTLLLDTKPGR